MTQTRTQRPSNATVGRIQDGAMGRKKDLDPRLQEFRSAGVAAGRYLEDKAEADLCFRVDMADIGAS
jgi:hypothetical protein